MYLGRRSLRFGSRRPEILFAFITVVRRVAIGNATATKGNYVSYLYGDSPELDKDLSAF